jgi:enoyl-CoA hydratase
MGTRVERLDAVAVVRLEHGKVNVLDRELCDEIAGVVDDLGADPGVGAVVLTGNGRAFSAGVDLKRIVDGGPAYARGFVRSLARCFETVLGCPKPTVAAVDGHAIAGGCVLACAADYRVMVDGDAAWIGLTELSVGVPFPASAAEIMRWRLGDHLLGPRVLLAGTVPAGQAVAARLADEAVPSDRVLDRAVEVAGQLAAIPTATFALTKAQLQADVRQRLADRRPQWDAEVAELWAGPAVGAAIARFVATRLGG